MKRSARKDKRNFIETRAEEAEKAAKKGDLNTVYKITKELSGKASQVPPVKNKNGKLLTTHDEKI